MKCVTYEMLEKDFGVEAAKGVWAEVCELGGFGQLSPLQAAGGLDIEGIVDTKAKAAIEKLLTKEKGK